MSVRRLYLDSFEGERRGVVTLDGRPERLLIEREGDLPGQALGARLIARVRAVNRAQNLAFLDVGEGPSAVLNLDPARERLVEGQAVEVEIRSEPRGEKGAVARLVEPSEGEPRVVAPGPALEDRLRAFGGGAEIVVGGVARAMADAAQDEAVATLYPLPGGGSIAIETTRALVAVDVDLGEGAAAEAKRAARLANFAAIGAAARILRLKGLGGLIVIDLVGRAHDAPALLAAARTAFAPDNPGVAIAPVSRFGVLELTIPRRTRPAVDILADPDGRFAPATCALRLARALEREAVADGGGRFEAVANAEVAQAAGSLVERLRQRLGGRLTLVVDDTRPRDSTDVRRL